MGDERKDTQPSKNFTAAVEQPVADKQKKVADMAVRLSLQAQMAVLKR